MTSAKIGIIMIGPATIDWASKRESITTALTETYILIQNTYIAKLEAFVPDIGSEEPEDVQLDAYRENLWKATTNLFASLGVNIEYDAEDYEEYIGVSLRQLIKAAKNAIGVWNAREDCIWRYVPKDTATVIVAGGGDSWGDEPEDKMYLALKFLAMWGLTNVLNME